MIEMKKLMENMHLKSNTSPQSNENIRQEEMFINNLFSSLSGIFPSMDVGPRLQIIKNEWTKAFIEQNISTMEQLERGLRKCRQSTNRFMPSVGEFISWCKPSAEELGLPSLLSAFEEAVKNARYEKDKHYQSWSHRAVYHAYIKSSWASLIKAKKADVPPDFKRNYEEMVRKAQNNEPIEEIPKILPPVTPPPENPAMAKLYIKKLKALFAERVN